MDDRKYIALDVGGTTVKAAIVDEAGRFCTEIVKTPAYSTGSREQIIENFTNLLIGLLNTAKQKNIPVSGVGIAFPGPFDYEKGISQMRGLGKYDSLYGLPLGEMLQEVTGGIPIRFANDADLYALGEGHFGMGARYDRVMCVCIGTGLGSGFVADGMLVKSGDSVPENGWIYNTPLNGEIADGIVSATGIRRMMRRSPALQNVPDVKELSDLARAGNPTAKELFQTFGRLLAEVVIPHAVKFEADALILGGEVSRSGDLFDGELRRQLHTSGIQLEISRRFGDNTLLAVSRLF